MNENDLRVQRSRQLLQKAFVDLLNSQPYGDITIRDITSQAQVGYKTFFRHYESKEALLQAIVDRVIGEFESAALPSHTAAAAEANTIVALQLARQNRKLFLAILNSPQSEQLLFPVFAIGNRDSREIFRNSDLPPELVAHHFAASLINLTRWWLENGAEHPLEEMLGFIERLLFQPLGVHFHAPTDD